jgi:hypothetical protein
MGSTARQRGVYGGEYAPTGLCLFAWWRKNGERRLQKPDSGSTGIRSYLKQRCSSAFYRWLNWARSPSIGSGSRACHASHDRRSIVCLVRWSRIATAWLLATPAQEHKAQPGHLATSGPMAKTGPARAHARKRARRALAASNKRARDAPWPLRLSFVCFFSFFLFFLLNKNCSIFINSYN